MFGHLGAPSGDLAGMYIILSSSPSINLIVIGCTAQLHIHKNQKNKCNIVQSMKTQCLNQLLRLLR